MTKKEPQNIELYSIYPIQLLMGNNFLDGSISFHKRNLYIHYYGANLSDKRINYSDIIWLEEPDVFTFGRKRINICTRKNEVIVLYISRNIKAIEFLLANTHLSKEKPFILSLDMNAINGQKIRRQFFNGPIYLLSSVLVPLYFFLLISDLATGHGFLETIRELIISLWVPFVWIGPLVILSFLNRSHFGRIICVLTPDGLQHDRGFIPWEQITMIEYEIVLPRRNYTYTNQINSCFAHIHVKDTKDLLLVQAPYMLLQAVQNYNPDIRTSFTKHSINTIRFFITVSILFMGISILIATFHM